MVTVYYESNRAEDEQDKIQKKKTGKTTYLVMFYAVFIFAKKFD